MAIDYRKKTLTREKKIHPDFCEDCRQLNRKTKSQFVGIREKYILGVYIAENATNNRRCFSNR